MIQPPLFCETIYDALAGIVAVLGGPKRVGAMLWPDKSIRDAGKLLNNCLNPQRKEKLDPEQMILLFRRAHDAGFHLAKHWFDTETGYVPSAPITAQEEQAQLISVIENAGEKLQSALSALERVQGRKPAIRALPPESTQTKVA